MNGPFFSKLWDWFCDCWTRPPRSTDSLENVCVGVTGAGENPLLGRVCTEPSLAEWPIVSATDPPICYGGVGACEPMPTAFRVAFPCKVPGSTCSDPSGEGCDPTAFLTTPSGVAGIYPPYADCPGCWTMTVAGLSSAGALSACCTALSGSQLLCYKPQATAQSGTSIIWGTDCVTSSTSPTHCGPSPSEMTRRREWTLEYIKADELWRLSSFHKIQQPIYELSDATPCTGDTKVLVRVSTSGTGCETSPATITITRGTTEDCEDCPTYEEPGCHILLVRTCGEDGYAVRSSVEVSADNSDDVICMPTQGENAVACCGIGCDYTLDECCALEKREFAGYNDPWFDTSALPEIVWALDLDADPPTLTGTFSEGNVVYEVNADGLQCRGVTHLNKVSTTLSDALSRKFPPFVCMVSDYTLTCNVRIVTDAGAANDVCVNAGYDEETGHVDFCNCFDTCEPSIFGSIEVANCDAIPVCATRTGVSTAVVEGVDPKTIYPRIACIQFWNGTQFVVLTQVIYCAGTEAAPNRWASDWYCTAGDPEELNPRNCTPCTAFLGSYLGTTFALKDECQTLPFFEGPEDMEDCVCVEVESCCEFEGEVPELTLSDGTDSTTLLWSDVTNSWSLSGPGFICGENVTIFLECEAGVYTLLISTMSDGYEVIMDIVSCDPFELSGTLPELGCTLSITL